MILQIMDKSNKVFGTLNLTGSYWMAVDNGFYNKEAVNVKVQTNCMIEDQGRFVLLDDDSVIISRGIYKGTSRALGKDDIFQFGAGKLCVELLP